MLPEHETAFDRLRNTCVAAVDDTDRVAAAAAMRDALSTPTCLSPTPTTDTTNASRKGDDQGDVMVVVLLVVVLPVLTLLLVNLRVESIPPRIASVAATSATPDESRKSSSRAFALRNAFCHSPGDALHTAARVCARA